MAAATTAPNAAGWYNTDVVVAFSCSDGLSGIALGACPLAQTLNLEGSVVASSARTVIDVAGNSSVASNVVTVKIDKTPPFVSLTGGPVEGASCIFGLVPGAPSCTASDVLSGVDGSCMVSGYAASVGPHIVLANARDKAGNQGTGSVHFTVLPWTLSGFYEPLDMGNVWNVLRAGATVPFKFEIFAGSTGLTDPRSSFSRLRSGRLLAAAEPWPKSTYR